jgi:hypothetical protein
VRDSEPVRDLNSELFSAKVAVVPTEAVRNNVRPRKKEDAKLIAPVSDLKKEDLSVTLELELNEPLRVLARPLT